jgi:hypothetical protein
LLDRGVAHLVHQSLEVFEVNRSQSAVRHGVGHGTDGGRERYQLGSCRSPCNGGVRVVARSVDRVDTVVCIEHDTGSDEQTTAPGIAT